MINGCCQEMLGWDAERTVEKVDAIYDTLLKIFQISNKAGIPTYRAADRLAEERLAKRAAG